MQETMWLAKPKLFSIWSRKKLANPCRKLVKILKLCIHKLNSPGYLY